MISLLLAATVARSNAFVPSSLARGTFTQPTSTVVVGPKASSPVRPATTGLRMGLDLVTYLRTEWISAALCTNQTPRSADVCLQLGTEDGRAGKFKLFSVVPFGGANNSYVSWHKHVHLCLISINSPPPISIPQTPFNCSDVHPQDDSHSHHIVCRIRWQAYCNRKKTAQAAG